MDKKTMTKREMDNLIEINKSTYEYATRNWDNSPYDGSAEMPDKKTRTKIDFIKSWINIIYPRLSDDEDFYNQFLMDSLMYTKMELEISFKWVYSNFLELRLGGNKLWLAVYCDLLDHLRSKKGKTVSLKFERELKVKVITGIFDNSSKAWIK
jgi:hypothetical protein